MAGSMACQPSGQGANRDQGVESNSSVPSTGPKRITVALVTAPTAADIAAGGFSLSVQEMRQQAFSSAGPTRAFLYTGGVMIDLNRCIARDSEWVLWEACGINDAGQVIDSSGVLPNGKAFQGSEQLKVILSGNRDAFAECLTEKLMIYALGRGLEDYDRRAVKQITTKLGANDYRFLTLISGIVNSVPFQMGRGDGGNQVTRAQATTTSSGGGN